MGQPTIRSLLGHFWTRDGKQQHSTQDKGSAHRRVLSEVSVAYETQPRTNTSVSSARRTVVAVLSFLLSSPWYLIPRRGRPMRQKAIHELHPMAYLDALRGYLALIIFTGHTCSRHWRWIPDTILQIPWLHFPARGGHACLDMFFWISGYVITYKMVGLMLIKRPDKVMDTLASSMFRRYLRLFLPVVITTAVTILLLETGVAILPDHKYKEKGMQLYLDGHPIKFWLYDSVVAVNPFSHVVGYWTKESKGRAGDLLLDQFWSINTEFRNSMILFCFCAATCKMSSNKRVLFLWLCIPILMCWEAQWAAMGLLGMLFGERRQRAALKEKLLAANQAQKEEKAPGSTHENAQPLSLQAINATPGGKAFAAFSRAVRSVQGVISAISRRMSPQLKQQLLIVLFLFSFYTMKDSRDTWTKTTFPHNVIALFRLESWAPEMKMHFHLIAGSAMMLNSLDQVAILKRPLLTPFSQYLGELSFGIYAVHITVRWIVWESRYLKWAQGYYGKQDFDHFWGIFPGWLMMTIVNLWAANLFCKADIQVVKFCKWLEDCMFEATAR